MRDHGAWSASLGRWGGVHVRLHMFFLLFATFTLFLAWREGRGGPEGEAAALVYLAGGSLAILFLSVLLHEWGHVRAAQLGGGSASQIVIGPLGGLASISPPGDLLSELFVYLAGPLVNLGLVLLSALFLLLGGATNLAGLLHPLSPVGLIGSDASWLITFKLTFWINWLLLLINLIPVYPFDGGHALRTAICLCHAKTTRQQAGRIVAITGRIAAVGLLLAAWFMRDGSPTELAPAWLAMILLAIFIFFSAQLEDYRRGEAEGDEEDFLGYDFSQGYTSLEKTAEAATARPPGPFTRWMQKRREAKLLRQQQIEAQEEQRADDILARLHEEGMGSLSPEDRAILERVSTRYRNRQSE